MSHLLKPIFYTTLALVAFAGNSVLCRIALIDDHIDAASFTNIRLLSGALTLLLLFALSKSRTKSKKKTNEQLTTSNAEQLPSVTSSVTITEKIKAYCFSSKLPNHLLPAIYLFIYAIGFSYAYISLATGTGALILFAAVQLTLLLNHFLVTKTILRNEWVGLLIAFSGLVVLVYPALATPTFSAFLPMSLAGIAWGLYTISGKTTTDPLKSTTRNFMLTIPLVFLTFLFTVEQLNITDKGIILAIMSGAITSGLGYFLWFIALKYLSSVQAGVLQLLVPVIATLGGVIFANEPITLTLSVALLLVLGGIFIVLHKKPAK